MTDEKRKRIHDITYSTADRAELAERMVALEDENAKLRELVRDLHMALFTLDIDHCQACPRDTINGPCTKYIVGGSGECSFEEDMHELGVPHDRH